MEFKGIMKVGDLTDGTKLINIRIKNDKRNKYTNSKVFGNPGNYRKCKEFYKL